MNETRVLFQDDFSKNPVEEIHLSPPWRNLTLGKWFFSNLDYAWQSERIPGWKKGSTCPWRVQESDGRRVMEQTEDFGNTILTAGEETWEDYSVEAEMRYQPPGGPIKIYFRGKREEQEVGFTGVCGRYWTGRRYYFWGADEAGNAVLCRRDEEHMIHLARSAAQAEPGRWYAWKLEFEARTIRAYLDGRLIHEVRDPFFSRGMIALRTDRPARYANIKVVTTALGAQIADACRRQEATRANRSRDGFPTPKVWKQVKSARDWGRVAFAELGAGPMILNDCRQEGGTSDQSYVEAVDLRGNTIWRTEGRAGRHRRKGGLRAWNLADLDGNGQMELVLICSDSTVQVLNCLTGEKLAETSLPEGRTPAGEPQAFSAYQVVPAYFTRDRAGCDLLLIDCYKQLLALDSDLQPLWHYAGNVGHTPVPGDVNGDGLDEVFVGSRMVDHAGQPLWDVPDTDPYRNSEKTGAHLDSAAVGPFAKDAPTRIAACNSQNGFYLLDPDGTLIARDICGHAQDLAVGPFRNDIDALLFLVRDLWGNDSIYTLYDCHGHKLDTFEVPFFGDGTTPINWTGTGTVQLIGGSRGADLLAVFDASGTMLCSIGRGDFRWGLRHVLRFSCDPRDMIGLVGGDTITILRPDDDPPDSTAAFLADGHATPISRRNAVYTPEIHPPRTVKWEERRPRSDTERTGARSV